MSLISASLPSGWDERAGSSSIWCCVWLGLAVFNSVLCSRGVNFFFHWEISRSKCVLWCVWLRYTIFAGGSGVGMLRRVEWETQDWGRLSTWARSGESGPSPDRPEERCEMGEDGVWEEPASGMLWVGLWVSLLKEKTEGFLLVWGSMSWKMLELLGDVGSCRAALSHPAQPTGALKPWGNAGTTWFYFCLKPCFCQEKFSHTSWSEPAWAAPSSWCCLPPKCEGIGCGREARAASQNSWGPHEMKTADLSLREQKPCALQKYPRHEPWMMLGDLGAREKQHLAVSPAHWCCRSGLSSSCRHRRPASPVPLLSPSTCQPRPMALGFRLLPQCK